jgi:hypothetical protein
LTAILDIGIEELKITSLGFLKDKLNEIVVLSHLKKVGEPSAPTIFMYG